MARQKCANCGRHFTVTHPGQTMGKGCEREASGSSVSKADISSAVKKLSQGDLTSKELNKLVPAVKESTLAAKKLLQHPAASKEQVLELLTHKNEEVRAAAVEHKASDFDVLRLAKLDDSKLVQKKRKSRLKDEVAAVVEDFAKNSGPKGKLVFNF